jgi:hypothetical protein
MAENPHADDESEDSTYTYLDMDESEDYVMRGMRFMFQRAEGEDFDEEDIEDEEDYDQSENSERESENHVSIHHSRYDHSYESVLAKLTERNVTPEKILKALLYSFTAYSNNEECAMMELHVTDIIADILSVPEYEGHPRVIV